MRLFGKKAGTAEVKSGTGMKVRVGVMIAAVLIPLLTGIFSALLTAADMKIFEDMTNLTCKTCFFLILYS